MDTNAIPVINYLPQKYQGYALLFIAALPYITRAGYAIMSGGGIVGMLRAILFGTNTPKQQQDKP